MEVSVNTLIIEFGAVVLGLAVIRRLATRLGLPVLPAYLLAGLAFGQGGILELGAASNFIEAGAKLGLILMLLMLGLEFSAQELIDNVRRSTSAGIADLLLNFPPGLIAGLLLGFEPLTAVLMGGVTYISSSGIVAKLVADLGRERNKETPVILSILIIEDLAMVLYLPVITALISGGSALTIATTIGVSLVVVSVILVVDYFYGDQLNALILSDSPETLLLTLLGITLIFAGLAENIHLSYAVGAFLVGVVLSGEVVSHARNLLMPLRHLFAASFFVFFGMQVDPSEIPHVTLIASALAVVTLLSKFASGWFAAKTKQLNTHAKYLTGSALIARGEFSIVIAELGLELDTSTGTPDLGALAATYVILLAAIGGVLYHFDTAVMNTFNKTFNKIRTVTRSIRR